jgi:hypothetical protein
MMIRAIQNQELTPDVPGFVIVFDLPLAALFPVSSFAIPLLSLLSPVFGVFPDAVPGVPVADPFGLTAWPLVPASLVAEFAGFDLPGSV